MLHLVPLSSKNGDVEALLAVCVGLFLLANARQQSLIWPFPQLRMKGASEWNLLGPGRLLVHDRLSKACNWLAYLRGIRSV